MIETITCPVCNKIIKKPNKYCSRKCYSSVPKSQDFKDKVSKANKGKILSEEHKLKLIKVNSQPKPWMKGINNINYGGKYTSDPIIRERYLKGIADRIDIWTEERRENLSKKMKGTGNNNYGKKHSIATRKIISDKKRQQYKDGLVKINLNNISKAEKEIANYFDNLNINYIKQFRIQNITYRYDFYLPNHNLIIEYQGDYWHANPNIYKSGTFLKIILKDAKLVDDIWTRDALKKSAAINNGYKFIAIWESDYKNQGLKIIDNILNDLSK